MPKTPKTPSGPSQTRSDTTAAAQTLFNQPNQPKAPVTTDNLTNTVDAAVSAAVQQEFAKKEKADMADLKKLSTAKKSGKKAATPKAKPYKPGDKKVSDSDLLKALLKEDSVRAALRSVGLNETSLGSRNRARRMIREHSKEIKAEDAKKKKAAKVKVPTADDVPDTPRKKPREKPKPVPGAKVPTKAKTPTGAAITQLAENLPKDKPKTSSLPSAKAQDTTLADLNKKASITPKTQVFDKAPMPVSKEAVQVVEEKSKLEKIPSTPTDDATTVATRIEPQRTEKSSAKPLTPQRIDRDKSYGDAFDALKMLGFMDKEIKQLLRQVAHIEKTEEKVILRLRFLKPKFRLLLHKLKMNQKKELFIIMLTESPVLFLVLLQNQKNHRNWICLQRNRINRNR